MKRILPKTWLSCFLLALLCSVISLTAHAQTQKVSLTLKNAKRAAAVQALQKQTSMEFFYNEDELNKFAPVTLSVKDKTITEVLNLILAGTGMKYSIEKNVVVITLPVTQIGSPTLKIKVSGKVTDDQGLPIPGVNIVEPQTKTGTTSNSNGEYVITVDKGATIKFSFIGMKPHSLPLTAVGDVKLVTKNITMQEDNSMMNEVVVTGYQNIARRDLVGSVASVKLEDIKIAGVNSIDKLLQGQLAGVSVANASGLVGAKTKLRVRGTSTLLGNQEPVWVVDGIIQNDPIPFDYQQLNSFVPGSADDAIKNLIGSSVAFLNVDDIQDITVLKDASSTAIYGVKAANGVIVITTKKGKPGKTTINYATNLTISAAPAYSDFKLMNSKERIDVSREIYEKGLQFQVAPDNISYEGLLAQLFDKKITQEQFISGVNRLEVMNTDWFGQLYQSPFSQTHSLSMSGGSDRTTYYSSVGITDQRGNTKGNEQNRYNASMRVNSALSDKLNVGFRLNGSYGKTSGFYGVDPFNYAFNTSRTLALNNDDGSPFFYVSPNTTTSIYRYNVLNELSQTGNTNKVSGVEAVFNLDYKFVKNFNFQSIFGYNLSNTTGETYATERSNMITLVRGYEYGTVLPNTPKYLESRLPNGGILNNYSMNNQGYTFRNSVTYNLRLRAGKDGLNVMAGNELRSTKYNGLRETLYGYAPDRGKSFIQVPQIVTVSGFQIKNTLLDNLVPTITDRLSNYLSYFGTATYNFNQKYVFNANIRTDASNRFGQNSNHRFLPIWSAGVKWNVAEEDLFNKMTWLNQFSLRASYGFQGNVAENFSPDLLARIPTAGEAVNPISGDPALYIQSLAYKDLRWERNKTVNLGVDFAFANNRISGTFDFYHKKGFDVIVQKPIPMEYGLLSMPINAGDVTNTGYELTMNFIPVKSSNFTWNVGFNTSRLTNKVVRAGVVALNKWTLAASGGLYKEGFPSSGIWSFDFKGLDPQTGKPVFDKIDPVSNPEAITDITKAMVYSGQLDPKFTGGLTNNFRYKSFTLNTFFNISLGNVKRLAPLYPGTLRNSAPYPFQNVSAELNNRWRQPGDEAKTIIPSLPTAVSPSTQVSIAGTAEKGYLLEMYDYSSARIVDASFVRLQNLSLGYIIPAKQIARFGLKSCNINASVSNVFYIASKKLNGVDPEVNGNSLPIPRNFSLSLNIGL